MSPAALPWIGAALLLGGMCFGGLLVLLFLAVVGKLPSAHIELKTAPEPPPAPDMRAGRHIRWEADRQASHRDLEAQLAAMSRAGWVDDTRPQWATNPTELHPRAEA